MSRPFFSFFMPLFSEVRGIGILGSSLTTPPRNVWETVVL
jgi:hypothetical protein